MAEVNKRRDCLARAALLLGVLFGAMPAAAQQAPAMSTQDLSKLVQNPRADTIMPPLANETNFRIGPKRETDNVLNIQPVVPFRANED